MDRGRTASTPDAIPARGWKDVLWRTKDEIAEDRVGLIAAGIAFYGLLALFPAITAIVALTGLLAEPQQITAQIEAMAGLIPQQVAQIITDQATEVLGSQKGGLGFAALFGFAIALYSASKGTASLMEGLNAAYDETETHGFIKKLAVRLGLTLFIVLGICVSLSVTLFVPAAVTVMSANPVLEIFGSLVAYVTLFALASAGLAVIYRYGPSRDNAEFKWVSPGALAACVLWVVASVGFAFYVGNFGNYNETFGALAGVVVLLMWFWISAFIVLLGAELNAEAEAQTKHDTTVGQDKPMGERDAVKADNLGEATAA